MRYGTDPFEHSFRPGTITFGEGCVDDLEATLTDEGWERALIFCGSNVASSSQLMDPVVAGLGDTLVTVFDGSTPAKHVGTVYECLDVVEREDIDVVVAIGGGSTLDLARAVRVLAAIDRPRDAIVEEITETATVTMPEGSVLPGVAIPTTLAGAEMSVVGGARGDADYPSQPDAESEGGFVVIDERLMPDVLVYDPQLFATTPPGILASSAMNGFDKAIEMLYSRNGNPLTDATASRGLRLFDRGLPNMVPDPQPDDALAAAINGAILSQYGLSVPGSQKISIIHAFGHGFSMQYEVQQGTVHGIVAPPVLEYVFDQVDGQRELMAEGLGIVTAGRDDDEVAAAIVDRVRHVRDELGLPTELRTIDGLERSHLPTVAEAIEEDHFLHNGPPGLDPTNEEIESILYEMW